MELITDAGDQKNGNSGTGSMLVNFFEAHNVGHVIEALHYCLGHHKASPGSRLSVGTAHGKPFARPGTRALRQAANRGPAGRKLREVAVSVDLFLGDHPRSPGSTLPRSIVSSG